MSVLCCCKEPIAVLRSTCATQTRARCTASVTQRALATCVAALVAAQETTVSMMRMIATRAVLTPTAEVSLFYTKLKNTTNFKWLKLFSCHKFQSVKNVPFYSYFQPTFSSCFQFLPCNIVSNQPPWWLCMRLDLVVFSRCGYRYKHISLWFRVGWSCCPPFCMLACPLLQSSVCLPLSWGVASGHSSTLHDQLQGPPKT